MSPRTVVRALIVVGMSGLLPLGYTQGRGGGSSAPPAGGTTTGPGGAGGTNIPTPSPGRTNIPSTNPRNTPQQQTPQQPIFLSGRVLLEDGTPPPETVIIESVCGTSQHNEGYTDSKGYFSIEFGRRMGVLQDASETSTPGFGNGGGFGGPPGMSGSAGPGFGGGMSSASADMRTFNCELRAKLAGYRSQAYSLVNRRPMDNPDIGVILLHRLGESEGTTVSASTLAAPKDARKAFQKGMDALKKRKQADAVKNFEKAVNVYPEFAAAWFELGRIQVDRGDLETARRSFDTAAKSDPKFVAPLVEIANLSMKQQNWKEVADVTARAEKLDSFDYPQIFLLNAVANYNLHNLEAAEKSIRQAEKLDTRHQFPKTQHLFGIILAQRQDYLGAAEQFKAYLKFAPSASDAATVRSQLDQVEKLTGQPQKPNPQQ